MPVVPAFLKDIADKGLEHITPEDTFDGDYGRMLERAREENGRKIERPSRAPVRTQIVDFLGAVSRLRSILPLAAA